MYISKALLVLIVTLTLAAFAVLGYYSITAFDRVNGASVTNCKEIELMKGAVRATIEQAQKFVQSSHVRSTGEKSASDKYYTEVLARFSARNCEKPDKEKHESGSGIPRKAPRKQ